MILPVSATEPNDDPVFSEPEEPAAQESATSDPAAEGSVAPENDSAPDSNADPEDVVANADPTAAGNEVVVMDPYVVTADPVKDPPFWYPVVGGGFVDDTPLTYNDTWGGWEYSDSWSSWTSSTSWGPWTTAETWNSWTTSETWNPWNWSTWSRSTTSVGPWDPNAATVPSGQSFTQTRTTAYTESRSGSRSGIRQLSRTGTEVASRTGLERSSRTGTRSWYRSGTRTWSDGTSESISESGQTESLSEGSEETVSDTQFTPLNASSSEAISDSQSESRTGSTSESQGAVGLLSLETWSPFDDLIRDWYPLSAWLPDTASVANGQAFTQSRTEQQDWQRGERSNFGGQRNIVGYVLSRSATRSAVGSLTYLLTTVANGPGTVTPGGTYNPNASLTITANPANGRFLNWSGDAAGAANPLLVTMDRSKTITGVFAAKFPQTINFAPASNVLLGAAGAATIPLQATASSGLAVAFTLVSGPGTLNAGQLSIQGPGAVVVQAAQPGDANYQAAPTVVRTINAIAGSNLRQTNRDDKIQNREPGGSNLVRQKQP